MGRLEDDHLESVAQAPQDFPFDLRVIPEPARPDPAGHQDHLRPGGEGLEVVAEVDLQRENRQIPGRS